MPKQTFLNLKETKRELIRNAFLREFAIKSYDDASLTEVVKELGIAKGSVYQYFEDKLDLFTYLLQVCSSVKMRYVGAVNRDAYPNFWEYFRSLYEYGFLFDKENPLESHFLHNLIDNLNSPSVKGLYHNIMEQTVAAFEKMVEKEIQSELFRDDISVKTMAFVLYKMGVSIQEHLEFSSTTNPKESIEKQEPVFQGKKDAYFKIIDEHIKLMKSTFDK